MQKQMTNATEVLEGVKKLAARFAEERRERQRRTALVNEDFKALADTGYTLMAVPTDFGGLWVDPPTSNRLLCDMVRTLAHGDSSLALVSTMHPAVLSAGGWIGVAEAPAPYKESWASQREWVFQTAKDGHFWGTITSEPGSGGDMGKTKAVAKRGSVDGAWRISGSKHFGSGTGMASYMITTAVAEGEEAPDMFFMDMQGQQFDGSAGATMLAPWDGHGMIATQSHAVTFGDMPATRSGWPDFAARRKVGSQGATRLFSAVITGIVETAIEAARASLDKKRGSLGPYERAEWSRIEVEGWLVQQAYEGLMRSVETGHGTQRAGLLGKIALAELAESVMLKICRTVGGGTFSKSSPFGYWFEDVRALGFLRPPWALAYDNVDAGSWTD